MELATRHQLETVSTYNLYYRPFHIPQHKSCEANDSSDCTAASRHHSVFLTCCYTYLCTRDTHCHQQTACTLSASLRGLFFEFLFFFSFVFSFGSGCVRSLLASLLFVHHCSSCVLSSHRPCVFCLIGTGFLLIETAPLTRGRACRKELYFTTFFLLFRRASQEICLSNAGVWEQTIVKSLV